MTAEEEENAREDARVEVGMARFCIWCHRHPRKKYRSAEVIKALADAFEIPDDQGREIYDGVRRLWREYAERVDA